MRGMGEEVSYVLCTVDMRMSLSVQSEEDDLAQHVCPSMTKGCYLYCTSTCNTKCNDVCLAFLNVGVIKNVK